MGEGVGDCCMQVVVGGAGVAADGQAQGWQAWE